MDYKILLNLRYKYTFVTIILLISIKYGIMNTQTNRFPSWPITSVDTRDID